jgi:hypothetical protein
MKVMDIWHGQSKLHRQAYNDSIVAANTVQHEPLRCMFHSNHEDL